MYATRGTPDRARWEVLWYSKGKRQAKDCGGDFSEAIRIYTLVVKAGRPGATLRCKNMAFPPPDKWADREEVIRVLPSGRKVKGMALIRPLQYQIKMGEFNKRGAYWCPYCIKLRKFVRRNELEFEGIIVPEAALCCPVCGITHNAVGRFNPYAHREIGRRTRSDKGTQRG